MPKASAPKAPCVLVWLSPHTIVVPGKRQPELRADDVDDALAAAVEVEQRHAERRRRCSRSVSTCCARQRIGDRQVPRCRRRHVVIDGREGEIGTPDLAAAQAQAFERLRRRHFVNEVTIDVEQGAAVLELAHDVRIPDLVEQGARCAAC